MSQSLFDFMFCGMVCWDLVDSKWLLSQRPNVLMFTSFGDIWQYILSVTFLALVNYSKTLNFSFSQSLPFLVLSLQESTFCKRYFLPLKGKNKLKKKEWRHTYIVIWYSIRPEPNIERSQKRYYKHTSKSLPDGLGVISEGKQRQSKNIKVFNKVYINAFTWQSIRILRV